MFLKKFYNEKLKYSPKVLETKIVLGFLKKCENILDIGCGMGSFLSHMPEKTIGLDSNIENVNRGREQGLNIVEGRATQLPFDDNSFYGVHCSHLIEHLLPDDAYKLILEIDRVLRPGGILCLRAPMAHKGFFDEFGHIKPYPPKSILTYLNCQSDGTQAQYRKIKNNYSLMKLRYQRGNIFDMFANSPLSFLSALGNILLRFKITGLEKISYIMVLKKEN